MSSSRAELLSNKNVELKEKKDIREEKKKGKVQTLLGCLKEGDGLREKEGEARLILEMERM